MRYKMLIDGKLVEGAGTIGVEDPATGVVFEQCPIADEELLDQAVAAAKCSDLHSKRVVLAIDAVSCSK